jgi:hypothetical protein
MSPDKLAIISVVVLTVGLVATAGVGFYLFRSWQELGRRSNQVKQKHRALDDKKTAIQQLLAFKEKELRELLIRVDHLLGGYIGFNWDMIHQLTPEETGQCAIFYQGEREWLTDRDEKPALIFSAALRHLDGYCPIRRLHQLVKPYNEQARAANEPKLALTEHFIRDTLDRYEYDVDHGGPVLTFWNPERHKQLKTSGMWVSGQDLKCFDNYILVWATYIGGKTRRLVPLQEIFERPIDLKNVIYLPASVTVVDGSVTVAGESKDRGALIPDPNGSNLLAAAN